MRFTLLLLPFVCFGLLPFCCIRGLRRVPSAVAAGGSNPFSAEDCMRLAVGFVNATPTTNDKTATAMNLEALFRVEKLFSRRRPFKSSYAPLLFLLPSLEVPWLLSFLSPWGMVRRSFNRGGLGIFMSSSLEEVIIC